MVSGKGPDGEYEVFEDGVFLSFGLELWSCDRRMGRFLVCREFRIFGGGGLIALFSELVLLFLEVGLKGLGK